MMKSKVLAACLVVVSTLIGSNASCQVAALDSVVKPKMEAISLVDLTSKIELISEEIKNIDRKTDVHKSIRTIDSLLPINKEKLVKESKAFESFRNSQPNKQKVINQINKWQSYLAYLEIWQKTINGFLNKNIVWLDEVKTNREQWELTLDAAKQSNSPTEVTKAIKSVLAEITRIEKKIEKQNNYFLDLETKVLVHKASINSVIDDLELIKHSAQFAVFHQRHLPIWEIEEGSSVNKKTVLDTWAAFKEEFKSSVLYLRSPENRGNLFLFLLVALSLVQWRYHYLFKQGSKKKRESILTENAAGLTNHFPSGIIFNASVFAVLFFSHTPNLLNETFLLLALISSVPILRTLAIPRFKLAVPFIIVIYILNTIKAYVWFSASYYRLFLMIEAVLGILIVVKLVHPYLKTRRLDIRPFSRFLVKMAPVLLALFSIAIVSNVLGYTNLTDLALNVAILGSALIVILFGIKVVFKVFAAELIHFHYSKMENYNYKNRLYIEKRVNQVVNIFAIVFVAYYFLDIIDVYFELVKSINDFLILPVKAGSLTFTWISILSFLGILIGSYLVTSIISVGVDGGALNFMKLPKGVPNILSVVTRYFITGFSVVIALSYLNIDLSKFNLMAGALGLGIGFGLQNIISNFISGLILIFERPVQNNDVVEIGPLIGTVKRIGVRSSHVLTFDGAEVVVPNSNLISNEVINWTLSDNVKRVEIKIGAAYGTDLQLVADVLKEVALAHKAVLHEPAPLALFDAFGNSALEFRLLYWVPVEQGIVSKSEISIAIYNRFKELGISIPFPQRDVNFKKEDLEALAANRMINKASEQDTTNE